MAPVQLTNSRIRTKIIILVLLKHIRLLDLAVAIDPSVIFDIKLRLNWAVSERNLQFFRAMKVSNIAE